MLILFDIDGTLLVTEGAGIEAMVDAGRELFGPQFHSDGVDFSGRLDPLIWDDLAALNGVDDAADHHDRFRAAYRNHLTRRLNAHPTSRLLPGVSGLVDRLSQLEHITLGLLTGNYPETGRLKIEMAGLDPDVFSIAAWGCDGPTRRDLPPLAMRHCAQRHGQTLAARQVVIIGDTPHDIDCAKTHGCRSLGVATGRFTVEQLRQVGADIAVENLAETQWLLDWLLEPGRSEVLRIG